MDNDNPFASWPHLDRPEEKKSAAVVETPTGSARDEDMASKNIESFLGGSPVNVFVKLLFISLVVGALLMWLEVRPMDVLHGLRNFIDRIYALGFDAVRMVVEYVLAGAVIVVPIWFVLRLMSVGGGKR